MAENQQTTQILEDESKKNLDIFTHLIFVFGILFPAGTLIFELGWQICAESFLDPIPTVFHVLLVGFVPLANLYLLICLKYKRLERTTLLGWSSAISLGVSLFYTLVFLPVMPISLIGIIVLIGIFGFAPIITFGTVLVLRRFYREVTGTNHFSFNWRGALVGFLIAFAIIAISESRFLITKHGLEMAVSENVEKQKYGLEFLSKYGDENYLLRQSESYKGYYYISDAIYHYLSGAKSYEYGKITEIFYRMNGKTTEQVGNPTRFGFGNSERSSRLNNNLSMISSEFDGSIDNDASLGYIEWIFEFKNDADFGQAEAIGQIQLPPDAVVSRLILWINGEEREAAYAERTRVTQAYEKVVSSKRDPVLVTTAGKDRVDMKCFPVMPKGGIMKVKIGITFPLILEDNQSGLLKLPYFRGKNFVITEDFQHKIGILSTKKLESADKNLKFAPEDKFFVMRGNVLNKNIVESKSTIRAFRSEEKALVWAKYDNSYIKQEIIENTGEKPARFVFAVDTSKSLKEEKNTIISAIESLPNDTEIGLVLTHGNALNREISYPNFFTGNPSEIANKIKQAEFGGGTDNLPALTKAWELAKEVDNGVVIWIHAPQPFKFVSSENLAKKLIRRSNQTEIYNFTIGTGFDEVEKELVDLNFLKNAPRFGDLKTDLNRLISQLNQSTRSLKYARTIDTTAKETVDKKTSKHMIRLWAFDEINEILASEKDEKSAIELAVKYQLVTPVTGAVVLETKEQYDDAGLKPAEKNVVHAVPEPETYIMMIIGLGLIIFLVRKQMTFG